MDDCSAVAGASLDSISRPKPTALQVEHNAAIDAADQLPASFSLTGDTRVPRLDLASPAADLIGSEARTASRIEAESCPKRQ
jgi:hypothetical protein